MEILDPSASFDRQEPLTDEALFRAVLLEVKSDRAERKQWILAQSPHGGTFIDFPNSDYKEAQKILNNREFRIKQPGS